LSSLYVYCYGLIFTKGPGLPFPGEERSLGDTRDAYLFFFRPVKDSRYMNVLVSFVPALGASYMVRRTTFSLSVFPRVKPPLGSISYGSFVPPRTRSNGKGKFFYPPVSPTTPTLPFSPNAEGSACWHQIRVVSLQHRDSSFFLLSRSCLFPKIPFCSDGRLHAWSLAPLAYHRVLILLFYAPLSQP